MTVDSVSDHPRDLTIHRAFAPRIVRTRVMTEFTCALTLVLLRGLTGLGEDEPFVQDVWFQHDEPTDPSVHERFFGRPARFSAPETRLVLSRAAVERPVLRRNPSLFEYLERHAAALNAAVADRATLAERVRREIATTLKQGEPRPATIARAFA